MARVRWEDGRFSSEVPDMCRVEDLSVKLKQRRLKWFRHVKRAEGGMLGEVREVRAGPESQQEGLGKSGVNV